MYTVLVQPKANDEIYNSTMNMIDSDPTQALYKNLESIQA